MHEGNQVENYEIVIMVNKKNLGRRHILTCLLTCMDSHLNIRNEAELVR